MLDFRLQKRSRIIEESEDNDVIYLDPLPARPVAVNFEETKTEPQDPPTVPIQTDLEEMRRTQPAENSFHHRAFLLRNGPNSSNSRLNEYERGINRENVCIYRYCCSTRWHVGRCFLCKGQHFANACKTFISFEERKSRCRALNLCRKCADHQSKEELNGVRPSTSANSVKEISTSPHCAEVLKLSATSRHFINFWRQPNSVIPESQAFLQSFQERFSEVGANERKELPEARRKITRIRDKRRR